MRTPPAPTPRQQEPGIRDQAAREPARAGGVGGQDRAGGGAWTSPPHTLGRSRAGQAQPAVAGWAGSALGCSGTGRVGLGSKPTTARPLLLHTQSRPCAYHPGAQSELSLSLCPLHSSPGASFLRVGTTCQWHRPFPVPSSRRSELHPGPAEVLEVPDSSWARGQLAPRPTGHHPSSCPTRPAP